jgi:predicted glycosyltransferase
MVDAQPIPFGRKDSLSGSPRPSGGCKFLLYSHDSHGLGHLRRNLSIARALLARFDGASAVIVTGSPCATQFPLPPNCDVIKIPAVGKDPEGRYRPRSLDVPLDRIIDYRRQLILTAYESYDPDVILVDHQPAGLMGEMMDVLERARSAGKVLVFGSRDIVDAPDVVAASWSLSACRLALEHFYERILVYGDRRVFDPLAEYRPLQRIADKVLITGYVAGSPGNPGRKPQADGRPRVLVTVGGGDDGIERIRNILDSLRLGPVGWNSKIVTGPLMPLEQVREFKQEVKQEGLRGRVKITRFHGDIPGLMQQSDAIVSMAGYNSCLEILQSGTSAVLIPRERMRQEQSIRAHRLAQLGLAQNVPVGDARRLRSAVEAALASKRPPPVSLNFDGLATLCDEIGQLAGLQSVPRRRMAQSGKATVCR